MRRAQAERSRTHARTRRKKTNTQADANEEEPKHLQHDAHKARAHKLSLHPHLMKLLNESTSRTHAQARRNREHKQNAKKDEAETSRHALL